MINSLISKIKEYSARKEGGFVDMVKDISSETNSLIKSVNDSNNSLIKEVDSFAVKVSTLRNKTATATNNMLSVSVASGNTNTQYTAYNAPIASSSDIISGKEITLDSSVTSVHQIFSIDVSTNGFLGNSCDYSEKRYYNKDSVSTSSHLEIEAFSSGVSATITADLKSAKACNMIMFSFKEFGLEPLSVGKVEVSKDGFNFLEVSPVISVSGENINIIFQDSEAKVIRFDIAQSSSYVAKNGKRRFPIGISNLKIGVTSNKETGEIVYGPFLSAKEILKASISCTIPNDGYSLENTTFEISHDGSNWTEISPPYAINDKQKIINYNNIAQDAIRTDNPVNSLYLRVKMNGKKINKKYHFNSDYNVHTQTVTSTNPSASLSFDLSDEFIVGKLSGVVFGETISYQSYSDNNTSHDFSESIRIGDKYSIKTLGGYGEIQKAAVSYPITKCTVEKSDSYYIYSAKEFDISSVKFYKAASPIKRDIRASHSANVVVPFSQPAGIYTLTDGIIVKKIDLTSGFFTSCYQWAFKAHEKDIYLIDPVGETAHVYKAGENISLLDYFTIEDIEKGSSSPVDVKFNREYPHKELSQNEFTVLNGKIFTASENCIVKPYTLYLIEIKAEPNFGIGKVRYSTNDISAVKSIEDMQRYDGKTIAKLKHTNIIKDTLNFDYSSASIFTFLNEVDFINGVDEFKIGSKHEVQIPKSTNSFSLGTKVDHFANIVFIGHTSVLSNRVFSEYELIKYGDYMLFDDEDETFIKLPNGVTTHDIINTKCIIDIPSSSSGNGYFSVDYINGIIYSQTKIDGNIKIEYLSSNIYAKGKELEYLDKSSYSINGRNINFNYISDNDTITVVSKASEVFSLDIYKSPVVKGLILNTVNS